MMKVIIIGNGIAGVMTALRLRDMEKDPGKLAIDIYAREPYAYYSRIRLPEIFGLNKLIHDIQIYKEDSYIKNNINIHYETAAGQIIPQEKKIKFNDNKEAVYDKLVLACGSDSVVPDINNNTLPGIFKIREYDDAAAVKVHMHKGAKEAVVLGGGLLGLEAARYLKLMKKISIIEIYPRLLPKQLDEEGALMLKDIIEGMGINIILNAEAAEFLGGNKLEGIRLKDGRILSADTAIISMGIKPRTELPKNAHILVNKGVVVNEFLESSEQDIYAAGDLVEFQNIVWGIIPAALDHAPVVAHNVLFGNELKYNQTIPKTTLKAAGVDLTSDGKVILSQDELKEYEIIIRIDKIKKIYEKYILKDDILKGAIILGNKAKVRWVELNLNKSVSKDSL